MPLCERLFSSWPALAGAALVAGATFGCTPDCGEKQEIRYEQGMTNPTHTEYQTTPLTGPLLHFPPSRIYFLVHGLKAEPTNVDINLSFEERGGNLAPGAGNQTLWRLAGKGEIYLENETCAEFYVHVFASTDPDSGPGADAGGD